MRVISNFLGGNPLSFILLSVPHNKCNRVHSELAHSCDFIAEETADYLADLLIDEEIPFVLLYGDINRTKMDLNRRRSRKTQFRKDLRKELKKDPYCLLDVHSFPQGDEDFKDADIAIGTDNDKLEQYLKDLVYYLAGRGINALVIGNLEADIVKEAKSLHVNSYLLEFNEGLDDEHKDFICQEIITYIVGTLEY